MSGRARWDASLSLEDRRPSALAVWREWSREGRPASGMLQECAVVPRRGRATSDPHPSGASDASNVVPWARVPALARARATGAALRAGRRALVVRRSFSE
jgi:hypothetical protein